MISDEDVRQLFQSNLRIQGNLLNYDKPYPTQYYKGVGPHTWEHQHPGDCERHMSVFNHYNIIPKYCFSCYKILIEPRTVTELFKLMMVFDKLELPTDNTRKCLVETREQVSGAYKGLIYCRGSEQGIEILKLVQDVVSDKISEKIVVTLKRGCSEYALAYPDYARVGQGTATMEYREEWQECEDIADKVLEINTQPPVSDTYNHSTYTRDDVLTMLAWLKYAATIGDLSYMRIAGLVLQPFSKLERPSPFYPVEDE